MLTPVLLEDFWPVARDRLVGALRAKGIDAETAEEAVAEAATRALSRGLVVTDVDDFCRWAYIVARNVAMDAKRASTRVLPVGVVPAERPDRYDLGRHVEARQRWRETAAAMRSLSLTDRAALLSTLDDPVTTVSRRESVKEAVRRHRARTRLHQALGQAGAFLGRRFWPHWPWRFTSSSDSFGALVVPLLAATVAWLTPEAGTGQLPSAPPSVDVAAPSKSEASATAAPARGASSRTPAPGASITSTGGGNATGATPSTTTEWWASDITPSPSYEEDKTMFAAGAETDCDVRCPVLFKSTDGGSTWRQLPAIGRDFGEILLPPAYPRDARIFSVSPVSFSVSTDGGQTFRVISTLNGAATMSPLFSDGDPRILFGVEPGVTAPLAKQYVDGDPVLRPLDLPLPPNVVPWQVSFSPDFAREGRLLATTIELTVGGPPGLVAKYSMYSCTHGRCDRVIEGGLDTTWTKFAWSGPDTVLVGTNRALHRSDDGGRTFRPVEFPGAPDTRSLIAVEAAPDGRIYSAVSYFQRKPNSLYISDDRGDTWRLVAEEDHSYWSIVVLGDGTLVEGRKPGLGAPVRCSVDGGRTWRDSCRRTS
ncbi:MAG TPA: hypothetical protein VM938_10760 [Acidimicrobiales bacterium]|nr:hypothetical protein [Acidimicrobiales bacterium]